MSSHPQSEASNLGTRRSFAPHHPPTQHLPSRSRYESPNLRYQRTASRITSGGHRNPAKLAEPLWIGGQDRRRFIETASPLTLNATKPFGVMDGVQWLLFAGAHTERHRRQLLGFERRADFPSNPS